MGRKKVWKQPTEAQYKYIAECCIEMLCKYDGQRCDTARIRLLLPKGYKWPDDFPPGGQRMVYSTPKGVENHHNARAVMRWLVSKGYSTVTYEDIMQERISCGFKMSTALLHLEGSLGKYIDAFDEIIAIPIDIEQELVENTALATFENDKEEV